MKLFTSQFGDSKVLVKKIMAAHLNSKGTWLYLKDLDCGDKRANFGLLLHGKYHIYGSAGVPEVHTTSSMSVSKTLFLTNTLILVKNFFWNSCE